MENNESSHLFDSNANAASPSVGLSSSGYFSGMMSAVQMDEVVNAAVHAYCAAFYNVVYTNQIVFDYATGDLDERAALAIGVAPDEVKNILGALYREDGKYAQALRDIVLERVRALGLPTPPNH